MFWLFTVSKTTSAQSPQDSVLAQQYFKRAKILADSLHTDSAIFYYVKSGKIYHELADWRQYLTSQLEISKLLRKNKKPNEALNRLKNAIVFGEKQPEKDSILISDMLVLQGSIEYQLGNFKQAEITHLKALNIRKAYLGEENPKVAESYYKLGAVYGERSQLSKSLEYIKKALDMAIKTLGADDEAISSYQSGLGYAYYKMSLLDEAIDCFENVKARSLKKGGELQTRVANQYLLLGNAFTDKGDYPKALDYFKKALKINRQLLGEEHTNVAGCYNNIGVVLSTIGDYEQAENYHQVALGLKIKAHGEMHPRVAKYFQNLGSMSAINGDLDGALQNYLKAQKIYRQTFGEKDIYVAILYGEIGDVYRQKGELVLAKQNIRRSIDIGISTVGRINKEIPNFHSLLAKVYEDQQEFDLAFEQYQHVHQILSALYGTHNPELAENYVSIGDLRSKMGQHQAALANYQNALISLTPDFKEQDIAKNPDPGKVMARIEFLNVLGSKARALKNMYHQSPGDISLMINAFDTYLLSIELIDKIKNTYSGRSSILLITANNMRLYEEGITVALALSEITGDDSYTNEAFKLAEKSKATLLLKAVKDLYAKKFANIPDSILAMENQIKTSLDYYNSLAFKEKNKKEGPDQATLNGIETKLFGLNRSLDSLNSILLENYSAYFDFKYKTDVTGIDEIQQRLIKANEAVVEYFWGDHHITAFVITKDDLSVYQHPRSNALDKAITTVREYLTNKYDYPAVFAKNAHLIFNALMAPGYHLIKGKDLIVIPDGPLAYVPMELLVTAYADQQTISFANMPYLIRDHAVSYAYSATLLSESYHQSRGQVSQNYLALAPNFNQRNDTEDFPDPLYLAQSENVRGSLKELKYTAQEIKSIANYADGQYYIGDQATENLFKKSARDFGILHLATHAIIDDKNPMHSRLLFTLDKNSNEDGDLFAWELYNMQLNAQMTVLSACNTGFGQVHRGEGVMSLGRAFAYAGCPSIIMSLWPAQDETTSFIMSDFYKNLAAGQSKDQSLRNAKINYLKKSDDLLLHPFYWAGFISQGNQQSLQLKKSRTPLVATIVVTVLIILIIVIIRQKKSSNRTAG